MSNNLQTMMVQAAIFELAIGIAVIGLMFWLTYLTIRAGVRDGIKESGLIGAVRYRAPTPGDSAHSTGIPDMRAD